MHLEINQYFYPMQYTVNIYKIGRKLLRPEVITADSIEDAVRKAYLSTKGMSHARIYGPSGQMEAYISGDFIEIYHLYTALTTDNHLYLLPQNR